MSKTQHLRPWKPGQSGNPGGRPKIPQDVKEMARGLSPKAIETLGEIMQDKGAPPAARVSAASTILDRGYGKAPQHITTERIDNLTDAELANELAEALAGLRALGSEGESSYAESGSCLTIEATAVKPKPH